MTTRAQLESEREALVEMLADNLSKQDGMPPGARRLFDAPIAALTASIARVDALLSLTDAQAAYLVTHEVAIAYADEDDAEDCDDVPAGELRPSETAAAHRTVAEIVRRTS